MAMRVKKAQLVGSGKKRTVPTRSVKLPRTWKTVKMRRTKSGDVQIRIPVRAHKANPVRGRARNGRSYVRRGVTPPRGWVPQKGDAVYIEGTKTRLGKPYTSGGVKYFPLRPHVRGTTDMSERNIRAVAYIEA